MLSAFTSTIGSGLGTPATSSKGFCVIGSTDLSTAAESNSKSLSESLDEEESDSEEVEEMVVPVAVLSARGIVLAAADSVSVDSESESELESEDDDVESEGKFEASTETAAVPDNSIPSSSAIAAAGLFVASFSFLSSLHLCSRSFFHSFADLTRGSSSSTCIDSSSSSSSCSTCLAISRSPRCCILLIRSRISLRRSFPHVPSATPRCLSRSFSRSRISACTRCSRSKRRAHPSRAPSVSVPSIAVPSADADIKGNRRSIVSGHGVITKCKPDSAYTGICTGRIVSARSAIRASPHATSACNSADGLALRAHEHLPYPNVLQRAKRAKVRAYLRLCLHARQRPRTLLCLCPLALECCSEFAFAAERHPQGAQVHRRRRVAVVLRVRLRLRLSQSTRVFMIRRRVNWDAGTRDAQAEPACGGGGDLPDWRFMVQLLHLN
ncbi:hypothetical protein C8F04DRAFT_625929 [Mycena alexandri]|uniref:Uncharacterized protein n=1 Tax=Mycena alexandri TaxID=1745969 RepID=A0AAD6STM9_9AGAR|nr:hypothetical protein C8F04DRAFT_625929 [Mycena alexandri]